MSERVEIADQHWTPDNDDGSGWALIDWTSVLSGRKYHYRHAEVEASARALRPDWYQVVTRLETPLLHAPHENDYYVEADKLAEFLMELLLLNGAEALWHVAPVELPPAESFGD